MAVVVGSQHIILILERPANRCVIPLELRMSTRCFGFFTPLRILSLMSLGFEIDL